MERKRLIPDATPATEAQPKLTKRWVEAQPYTEAGQRYVYDCDLTGFGLCIGRTTKTYCAEGRVTGTARRIKIGRHGVVTAEAAREQAHKLLQKMALGTDPVLEERQARAAAEKEERLRVTLAQLWQNFRDD